MKNILIWLTLFTIIVIGCKNKEDNNYLGIYFNTTIQGINSISDIGIADSAKYTFYLNKEYSNVVASAYTDAIGSCKIQLKSHNTYYYKITSATYKNNAGSVYHYELTGQYETNIATPEGYYIINKMVLLKRKEGKGSTFNIYNDPVNY